MSKTLTFEMPDEIYQAIQRQAGESGRTAEELTLMWLAERLEFRAASGRQSEPGEAWDRLDSFAGIVSSGNPRSADNAPIDADLTREYAGGHEEPR